MNFLVILIVQWKKNLVLNEAPTSKTIFPKIILKNVLKYQNNIKLGKKVKKTKTSANHLWSGFGIHSEESLIKVRNLRRNTKEFLMIWAQSFL